jgi:lysyl-tRNA synthetase class 2
MKQISSLGYDQIYQMGSCFRNVGELAEWHNPEFTMLEWYRKKQSFESFMCETEDLIRETIQWLSKSHETISIPQFTRISVYEAFEKYCGVELIDNDIELPNKLEHQGLHSITENDDFESAFFKALLERIEPSLKNLEAVTLFDYPPSQAALSVVTDKRAKRVETYLHGNEISNGFLELLDPNENKKRIKEANLKRIEMGFEITAEDEHFYSAMDKLNKEESNMCGNALGVDRLLAVSLGLSSIDKVIPFRGQIFHP